MTDDDPIGGILRKDSRYAREAFEFVNDALREAHVRAERAGRSGHVTGRELLEAFRDLAARQFGPLARTVLEAWGVRSTEDVGNIVFLCVEAGAMGKTDDDSIEDFRGVYDFAEALPDSLGDVSLPRRTSPDADED